MAGVVATIQTPASLEEAVAEGALTQSPQEGLGLAAKVLLEDRPRGLSLLEEVAALESLGTLTETLTVATVLRQASPG